ncbi:MAG: hypothetical protein AAF497_24225, partial [Planctomycetota bacterium]
RLKCVITGVFTGSICSVVTCIWAFCVPAVARETNPMVMMALVVSFPVVGLLIGDQADGAYEGFTIACMMLLGMTIISLAVLTATM